MCEDFGELENLFLGWRFDLTFTSDEFHHEETLLFFSPVAAEIMMSEKTICTGNADNTLIDEIVYCYLIVESFDEYM